jgi:tyrosyl-tRNA synthetase
MEVDMEIGGTDQTFNMLCGRDLIKSYLAKEKFVRTNKMMDAPDGRTMSKTKGNGINLADSPEQMFGKAMSYSDEHIIPGFELLTNVPTDEIEEMKHAMEKGENPMIFKKKMAHEVVKMIKGQVAAEKARDNFERVFSKRETPETVAEIAAAAGDTIVDAMVRSGLAASRGDAKRKIEQGGVTIDGQKVTDVSLTVSEEHGGKILKVGKKEFRKMEIK